jgi:AraC-like DNA-binding protein
MQDWPAGLLQADRRSARGDSDETSTLYLSPFACCRRVRTFWTAARYSLTFQGSGFDQTGDGMETHTLPLAGYVEAAPNASVLAELIAGAVDALERDRASTRSLLQQAIAILQKDNAATQAAMPAVRQSSLAPWQAKRVAEHISAHLERSIGLRELAGVARLSHSHFSRAFKGAFGQTPHTFIMSRRVAVASQKMLNSRESLSQIALSCGFSDQAHLARLFRRETGFAPSQWRRANQSPPD